MGYIATLSPVQKRSLGRNLACKREEFVNSFVDSLCLFVAEIGLEPFRWLPILLCIIATVFAVTQRHYILRDRAGAIIRSESYPMIGGDSMPKTLWATASGATTAEIVKSKLPIRSQEINWTRNHARRPSLANCSATIWIIFLPLKCSLQNDFSLAFVVQPIPCSFYVSIANCFCAARCNSGLTFAPSLRSLFGRLWITRIVIASILAIAIPILLSPSALLSAIATLALRSQSIRGASVTREIVSGRREFIMANSAAFQGVSPYWPYFAKCGKAVRPAFQRIDQMHLSHTPIVHPLCLV